MCHCKSVIKIYLVENPFIIDGSTKAYIYLSASKREQYVSVSYICICLLGTWVGVMFGFLNFYCSFLLSWQS